MTAQSLAEMNCLASSYTINPTALTITSDETSDAITVSTTEDCDWGAVSNVDWFEITAGSYGWNSESVSGDGYISFSVEENTGEDSRSGIIEIAGHEFTLTQEIADTADCLKEAYEIDPAGIVVQRDGYVGKISVTAESTCTWKAESRDSWITITDGSLGWEGGTVSGDGYVEYSVEAYFDDENRSGGIAIAGHIFQVTQKPDKRSQWPCFIEALH